MGSLIINCCVLQSYIVYLGAHSHAPNPSALQLESAKTSHYTFLGTYLGRYFKIQIILFFSFTFMQFFITLFWFSAGAAMRRRKTPSSTRTPDISMVSPQSLTIKTLRRLPVLFQCYATLVLPVFWCVHVIWCWAFWVPNRQSIRTSCRFLRTKDWSYVRRARGIFLDWREMMLFLQTLFGIRQVLVKIPSLETLIQVIYLFFGMLHNLIF